jgi:glutamyl-Q tRNA(Asp) synthetase
MSDYVGRFAPSPTGPLHFGSLVAAVASYCDAKAAHGKWLVRIEDVDKPREAKGATQAILDTLMSYGFAWDGDIIYQSQQSELYEEALTRLRGSDLAYPCTCSRKEISDSSSLQGIEGIIYPGTCLHQPIKSNAPIAWRIKTQGFVGEFKDVIHGDVRQDLSSEVGDFVIKRADGLFAYQLAVVIDDALQGVTHVVRGADLLLSTPRQIYLKQLLGLPDTSYAHFPIVKNTAGEKLSKQTLAPALQKNEAKHQLLDALTFLNQSPPDMLSKASLSDVWHWAISNWQINYLKTN